MIQRVAISIDSIIDKTIAQSSQDFRSLRTQKPDIDTLFPDFVVTPDDRLAIVDRIKTVSAYIYQGLKDYVCQWYVDEYVCFYFKTDADPLFVENSVYNIMSSSILSWWYTLRLPELADVYTRNSNAYYVELKNAVIPMFGTRRLRMF